MRRLIAMLLAGALSAAATFATAGTQLGNGCFRVVNVDMWDVLYIRARRTHLSTAVGAIAPDHTGVLRSTGPCLPKGASSRRQWCPVEYAPLPSVRISGYVKAYFVTAAACPPSPG